MKAGLITATNENVECFGIVFTVGDRVPRRFSDLWQQEKAEVTKGLIKYSATILRTSIPNPIKLCMWAYFRTKPYQLKNTTYPVVSDTFFGENRVNSNDYVG